MQMATILVGHTRHVDDTPPALLAVEMQAELVEQRGRVEPIRFGAPPAGRPIDRARVHDRVRDPVRRQRAV
jgi:hypothetical protein